MEVPSIFYFAVINFAIFVVAIVYFLRKPLNAYFSNRSSDLNNMITEAQSLESKANDRLRIIENRLASIEVEITNLNDRFLEEGKLEREQIIERANDFASRAKNDSERMMEQEMRRMREQLRNTTIDMAIIMAERILRDNVTPEDQGRLAKEYIEKLGALQ